jgi:2-keto-4-pentenoate hydratase/2-oxohepta-3-ene-1,7-dioic acid hydratase in catechol pathway
MKWLRLRHEGRDALARLDGHTLHLHEDVGADVLAANAAPGTGQTLALAEVMAAAGAGQPLLPPCRPSKIVGLWNNFRAAAAKNGWAEPAEPLWFLKSPSSLCGHGAAIPAPRGYDGRVAYEGELAIVIGRRAAGISEAAAAEHILGYTCANDVTAMELLGRDASFAQWSRAKSFDGFCAVGPWIATDFEATAASLRTVVGGRERQNYALADMFFSPHQLVSLISQNLTLEAGDLILCGTSLGVLPMKPGSTVDVTIDGIGTLANVYAPVG